MELPVPLPIDSEPEVGRQGLRACGSTRRRGDRIDDGLMTGLGRSRHFAAEQDFGPFRSGHLGTLMEPDLIYKYTSWSSDFRINETETDRRKVPRLLQVLAARCGAQPVEQSIQGEQRALILDARAHLGDRRLEIRDEALAVDEPLLHEETAGQHVTGQKTGDRRRKRLGIDILAHGASLGIDDRPASLLWQHYHRRLLVPRTRSSHTFAANPIANFGIGTLAQRCER